MKGKLGMLLGAILIASVALLTIPTAASAWNCAQYNSQVLESGVVQAENLSGSSEPSQSANVYVNGSFVATLPVPAMPAHTNWVTIGSITPPAGSWTWLVVGSADCSDSGGFEAPPPPPTETTTPTPTSTEVPTETPSGTPTEPPTSTAPPTKAPTCPTCGPHQDEIVVPNTVFKAWYGIAPCRVCAFELEMAVEVRVVIIGEEWQDFYILDEGTRHDSTSRTGLDGVVYNDVAFLPQSDGWMIMDESGNRISADVLPRDNHIVCGLSVGYQDTDANGTAYWHNGHNTWEWQYWLTNEGYFDRSEWSGATLDWVLELRANGTNRLPPR